QFSGNIPYSPVTSARNVRAAARMRRQTSKRESRSRGSCAGRRTETADRALRMHPGKEPGRAGHSEQPHSLFNRSSGILSHRASENPYSLNFLLRRSVCNGGTRPSPYFFTKKSFLALAEFTFFS